MKHCLVFCMLAWKALGSAGCPVYNCGQIETGNCVNIRDGVVTLSDSACPSGQSCSYTLANAWITSTLATQASTTTYNALYPCSTDTYSFHSTDPNDLSCPARPLLKDLQSGSNPKVCSELGSSSPECQLQDSTFAACICGLDGNAYCEPSLGSSVYSDYWEECTTSGYKGTLESEAHWQYWTLRYNYYIPYMTAYSCAHRVFSEFILLDNLVYTASSLSLVLTLLVLT